MIITIALTQHQELGVVPWQELDGMQRLHVFLVRLTVDFLHSCASCRVIRNKTTVVLVAVQFEHIDCFRVWTPGDVREIARLLQRCRRYICDRSLQINSLVCLEVVYAYSYHMGVTSRHGVFVGIHLGNSLFRIRTEVHLWIIRHHALVHTVESQFLSVRTPECSLFNAELITVYALTIDDFARAVGGELMLVSLTVGHIQLMVLDISRGSRSRVPIIAVLS